MATVHLSPATLATHAVTVENQARTLVYDRTFDDARGAIAYAASLMSTGAAERVTRWRKVRGSDNWEVAEVWTRDAWRNPRRTTREEA
jgi:hypothetical protein